MFGTSFHSAHVPLRCGNARLAPSSDDRVRIMVHFTAKSFRGYPQGAVDFRVAEMGA